MHDTSLLRKVDLKIYSKFFLVSKTVKISIMDSTYSNPFYRLKTPPLTLLNKLLSSSTPRSPEYLTMATIKE